MTATPPKRWKPPLAIRVPIYLAVIFVAVWIGGQGHQHKMNQQFKRAAGFRVSYRAAAAVGLGGSSFGQGPFLSLTNLAANLGVFSDPEQRRRKASLRESPNPVTKGNGPKTAITRSQAIKAAEAYLRDRGGLSTSHKVDAAPVENGEWAVTFRRVPAIPGGYTIIFIGKNGSVVRIERG